MNKLYFCIVAIVANIGTSAIAAEEQRYNIQRSADGYVRTDTQTGAISVCTKKNEQLICRMAADDRQAYDADIAALEKKIDSLEKRLTALENDNPAAAASKQPAETETEFQTSLDRMEQFFHRFMGIVKEFQVFGSDAAPAPDRTSF